MRKNRRITPEGTRDLLFEECLARREVETRLTDLFVQRGFSEVMTPGIEFYDVVPGDNEAIPPESVYKLTDTKGRLLAVRPDSTMPIARLTATRLQNARLPIRLYYAQDVFRLNHGMAGHNDQIFQAGVELIGAGGERADLEMISLAAQSLRSCAGEKFRLEIGHVGVFRSLVEQLAVELEVQDEIRALVESKNYAALGDRLDTLPAGDTVAALRRLPRLFGGREVLREARAFSRAEDARRALDQLERLYGILEDCGLGENVTIDLGLVHRQEYYTGVIFRGYIEGSGDTVVSGGRYDTLLRQFGPDLPATGFGVNVDSLTKVMLDRGEIDPPMPPEILVAARAGSEAAALNKVNALTEEGYLCEFSVFDTLKEALDYAGQRQIDKVMDVASGADVEIYEL